MPDQPQSGSETPYYHSVSYATRGEEHLGDADTPALTGLQVAPLPGTSSSLFRAVIFDTHSVSVCQGQNVQFTWHRSERTEHQSLLFALVRRGNVEVASATGSLSLTAHDIAFINTGNNSEAVTIRITHEGELVLLAVAPDAAPTTEKLAPRSILLPESAMIRATSALLASATQSPPDADPEDVATLRELTLNTARAFIRASQPPLEPRDLAGRALELLETRFHSQAFSVDDIARELQASRRTLERAAASRGITMSDELSLLRTKHAESLLITEPTMSVAEAAAASGFGSAEVMRRAFQRHLKQSPTEVRANGANETKGTAPKAEERDA